MLKDLILKNRSYRRFSQEKVPTINSLKQWIDLARLSSSASNLQPLRYIISNDAKTNALVFPCLAWARFLKTWKGPAETERPTAYILILGDTRVRKNFSCDHGIAAQSILLGATEQGFGGCMVGDVNRPVLRKILNIAEPYEILLVLALGKPAEKIILEDANLGDDIKYYRDQQDQHHVPKIKLNDLVLETYEGN